MGKKVSKVIRISVSDDMRIRELAEVMGISQSAVIRILLRNSITQICDETLSKAAAQQDAT